MPAIKTLKLYVWEDALTDRYPGIIVAVAPDLRAAKAAVRRTHGMPSLTDRKTLENLGMQPGNVDAALAAAGAQAAREDDTRIWWSVPLPAGTRLAAFREDGTEVLPGEPIKDFRGDPAVFIRATRAPGPGHTGKIEFYTRFYTAADARRLNWVAAGKPNTSEVYMTVFNLTVREIT